MKRNNIFLVIFLLVCIVPVSYAENGSYVVVETESPIVQSSLDIILPVEFPPEYGSYRIAQGQAVYLNDTIDISGMGHGCDFAWYGTYGQYDDPQYIRYTDGSRKDVMNFYIDPAIFGSRTGMWYQYYGNKSSEPSGNLDAFYVIATYRNYTETHPNGTTFYKSEVIDGEPQVLKVEKEKILPDVVVADYLVARGDFLDTNFTKQWIFGRIDGIYDVSGYLSEDDIWGLEPGVYSLIHHEPGNNTISEVYYNSDAEYLESPFRYVDTVNTSGLAPSVAKERFYDIISYSDDVLAEYTLEVQDPMLSIVRIDEVAIGNRVPYVYEPGTTLLDVRGYTNVANGTEIKFILNPDKQTARTIGVGTVTTTAIETAPGNMRVYRAYIPINKNQMPNDVHTIKGWVDNRCEVYSDFVVSELPPDSFVPNASLKYIDNRNPWQPNLTVQPPEIIEKVVTQIVTVEVTPSDEVVYAQQLKAQEEIEARNWENTKGIAGMVFAGIAILAGLGYAATVVFRGKYK